MKSRTADMVLLPVPKGIVPGHGNLLLRDGDSISINEDDKEQILPIAQMLRQELADLTGVQLSIVIGERSAYRLAITFKPGSRIASLGYELSITGSGISIGYNRPSGAFYATRTLKQIARQYGKLLPSMTIYDEPDFPSRGFMLDIGRDKIPTMETLYRIVDMMADVKLNHLELYIEGSPFAYASYPFMWESETPITGEEIMNLDRYCRERFIELVPNQNSFGHMAPWLAHRSFRHLAECPDGFDFHGHHMPPTTLDPTNPGSIEFIQTLYDDLLPYFSSKLFNVGCDETWELGKGKSKSVCEERGVGRVYLDYLLKIHKLVTERGKTMMFWGDIIGHHPELVPELPPDVIALEWGYEGNHPFETNCKRFQDAGVPFFVCPGTSSWNSIAGRTENMMQNLFNAARSGLAAGAIGFLNTDWGDNGHWQYLPVSYAGLAYGAAVSWACESNRDVDLASYLDRMVFQEKSGVMGRFVLDLGNYYLHEGKHTSNSTAIFQILNSDLSDKSPLKGLTEEALLKTRNYVDELAERLSSASMQCDDAELVAAEFANAIGFIRHGIELGLTKMKIAANKDSQSENPDSAETEIKDRLRALEQDIKFIIQPHKTLWLERNRLGGLDRSTSRLERLKRQYAEY